MEIIGFVGIGAEPGSIHVAGLKKRYANGIEALKNVSFDVRPGDSLTLLGPADSGNSVLLSILAGDERASEGEVMVGGKVPGEIPSTEREGLSAPRAALRPGITVYENLAQSLDFRGVMRRQIARAIKLVAEALDIEDLLERYPGNLSSAEQDRIQIAKIVVTPAQAYLVDGTKKLPEPLADVGRSIEALREHRGATVVSATTDPQEAIMLGGRIAFMNQGVMEQVGTPDDIFQDPQNLNVAFYVAPGGSAFVEGTAVGGNLRFPDGEVTVPHLREALLPHEGRRVVLRVSDERLSGEVPGVHSYRHDEITMAGNRALPAIQWLNQRAGQPANLPFDPGGILAFSADTGDRIGTREAEVITVQHAGHTTAASLDEPTPGARAVNAWLIGTRPPIPVEREVRLGFNIGASIQDALASTPFSEPDWGGQEEMECDVILLSDGCDVSPPGQKLLVPRLGTSPSLEFRIRARDSGSISLRFQIYLTAGGLLLQELTTSIEAIIQTAEVSL